MSVLDEITRAVTDTARTAAKISSNVVEVTKLTVAISSEEDKMNRQLLDLGKRVYEKFGGKKDIIDEEIAENCSAIKDIEGNIAEMKVKILNLKKIKECPGCKEILDIDMTFCFKCGEKQPAVEIIIGEDDVPDCEELTDECKCDGSTGSFEGCSVEFEDEYTDSSEDKDCGDGNCCE